MNKQEIIRKLRVVNHIELLDEYTRSTDQHKMQCLICSHIWTATPTSKIRGYAVRNTSGCPNCVALRVDADRQNTKERMLSWLREHNTLHPLHLILLYPPDQEYVNSKTKLRFRCGLGHVWNAAPNNVLYNGTGCPQCKLLNDSKNKRTPIFKIRERLLDIYGAELFDLTNIEYTNMSSDMVVWCRIHGQVTIAASLLLHRKQGCKQCNADNAMKERLQRFLTKSNDIHDRKYDYSNITALDSGNRVMVNIGCPEHGMFKQGAGDHQRGHGCPRCVTRSFSKKQIYWLEWVSEVEGIEIIHALNGGEFLITGTRLSADGFCKDTNTVYEFHGDAFHGNLDRYSPNEYCHPYNKSKNAKQWNDETTQRELLILSLGYNLVTIWESDFDALDIPICKLDMPTDMKKSHGVDENLLSELNLYLIDDTFEGFKHMHNYGCTLCDRVIVSSLTAKKQSFKRYGSIGCPNCAKKQRQLTK